MRVFYKIAIRHFDNFVPPPKVPTNFSTFPHLLANAAAVLRGPQLARLLKMSVSNVLQASHDREGDHRVEKVAPALV